MAGPRAPGRGALAWGPLQGMPVSAYGHRALLPLLPAGQLSPGEAPGSMEGWGEARRPGEWVRGGQVAHFCAPQGWVLVEGVGDACCHCALPGKWVWVVAEEAKAERIWPGL